MDAILDTLKFAFVPVKYMKAKYEKKSNQEADKKSPASDELEFESKPLYIKASGYFSHIFLIIVGYVREGIYGKGPLDGKEYGEKHRDGYAPLLANFESFYTRCVYRRVKDTFFRPFSSVPGATITLVNRVSTDNFWTFKLDESDKKECVNLASYNYLGFAENKGPCTEYAIDSISHYGMATCSPTREAGSLSIHKQLERTVSEFLGTEDAITFGMGFATNSLNLPRLVSQGSLVLSDEKNHASLILGLKLSGATVKVFKHNNVEDLESILRTMLVKGQPKTGRPWKKVLIVVEGVYSMEGSIVRLPEIVAIKKKYKTYLYLDEAHSVGAMGPNGRGVVDYFGLNPKDIDILMGTFTKSFGSAGGYIAGSRRLIDHLRVESHGSAYATSLSPPVAAQIIASMSAIIGREPDAMERIERLARNTQYFRRRLQQIGGIVYGHDDSPVVPLMVFFPSKIRAIINGLFDRGVAVVGVGFPATHMTEERVRFCVSASHTKEILDEALVAIEDMADYLNLRYSSRKVFQDVTVEY